jgi:hypothetical protein
MKNTLNHALKTTTLPTSETQVRSCQLKLGVEMAGFNRASRRYLPTVSWLRSSSRAIRRCDQPGAANVKIECCRLTLSMFIASLCRSRGTQRNASLKVAGFDCPLTAAGGRGLARPTSNLTLPVSSYSRLSPQLHLADICSTRIQSSLSLAWHSKEGKATQVQFATGSAPPEALPLF